MLTAIALAAVLATGRTAHDREPVGREPAHENVYVPDPEEPKPQTQSVPEPGELIMLLSGAAVVLLTLRGWRRGK